MRAFVPATASTYRRVSVAMPDSRPNRLSKIRSAANSPRAGPSIVPTQLASGHRLAVFGLWRPAQTRLQGGQRHLDARQPGHHARLTGHDAGPAHGVLVHQGPGSPVAQRTEVFADGQGKNRPQVLLQGLVPNSLLEFSWSYPEDTRVLNELPSADYVCRMSFPTRPKKLDELENSSYGEL